MRLPFLFLMPSNTYSKEERQIIPFRPPWLIYDTSSWCKGMQLHACSDNNYFKPFAYASGLNLHHAIYDDMAWSRSLFGNASSERFIPKQAF